MPSGVYSERFVHGRGLNITLAYVVPVGKRAVARFLSVSTFGAVPAGAYVFVAGVVGFHWTAPVANGSVAAEMRLTAYAGENFQVATYGPDTAAHLSGFLFDDPGGALARAVVTPAEKLAHELEVPQLPFP